MNNEPKFPHVKVKLTGEDGNTFAILARTSQALRKAGVSEEDRKAYMDSATEGDYDHLLRVTMQTVSTE